MYGSGAKFAVCRESERSLALVERVYGQSELTAHAQIVLKYDSIFLGKRFFPEATTLTEFITAPCAPTCILVEETLRRVRRKAMCHIDELKFEMHACT